MQPVEQAIPLLLAFLAASQPIQPQGATLAGLVVDPEGRPVAGATVRASLSDPVPGPRPDERLYKSEVGQTGADGAFRLQGLMPEMAYRVFAEAQGFVSAWEEAVPGKPGEKGLPLRIALSRGVVFTGRIVDPDGQPVAGAELDLHTVFDGPEENDGFTSYRNLQAASDAAGRFRFDRIGKGDYALRVRRPGFASTSRSGTVGTDPKGVVDIGDLALEPGAAIEGRVTDLRGVPVEGAQVVIPQQETMEGQWFAAPTERQVLTGPDGSFRIEDLGGGRRFQLSVHKPGFVLARLPGVEAPTKEALHIELRPARSLSVQVLDAARRPVRGASLTRIEEWETGVGGNPTAGRSSRYSRGLGQTDEEGRFLVSGLESGLLNLEVRAPGFRTAEVRGLRIPEDEDPPPVEVVLQEGAVLEGRVLDGRGQPLSQARVHAIRPDSRRSFGLGGLTDEEGRYRIDGLEPGEHRIMAEVWGSQARAEGKVVLGETGRYHLDLRLPSGVDVSGQVVDEQGEPLRGASLSLQAIQNIPPRPGHSARSATDGSFRFRDVPDGLYRLTGSASDHVSLEASEVHVAGQEVGGLILRLARSGTITGRILGITEEDRGMIFVEASREEDGESHGTNGRDGAYRLAVAPGTWRVRAFLLSGRSATGTVSVGAGEEAVLDLELQRGLTLSGRVLLDGQPLAGAEVLPHRATEAENEMGPPPQATTRYDGSFVFRGLRPGRLSLTVFAQGLLHARSLDLATDREITIEISSGRISGHVLTSTGLPIEGAVVSLRGESPDLAIWSEGLQARTDETGAFEVPRLAAGSYRITVTQDGFESATQNVVVTPGGVTEIQVVLK